MKNSVTTPRKKYKKTEKISGMIMSAPAVLLLIGFLIIPIIYTVYYSFFTYQVMRPDNIVFSALDNYKKIFQDENFWLALRSTVYFTILVVPFQCILALALALLVSSKLKGVSIFRTMYFSPQVTSMVVIAILWTILYNSNVNTGLINAFLGSIGFGPIDFLNNPKTAMNAIIFMSAWQGAGYQMMIFLAGLNGIPQEQYEAASVDGAGKIAQFLYVTLPGLSNTIKYVLMITIIQAMKLFTQPYIMTKGGPQNSTKTLVYYIYEQGFQKGNLIIGLIFISPLIWMISSSFKQELSIFSNMTSLSTFLPLDFTVDNYRSISKIKYTSDFEKYIFIYRYCTFRGIIRGSFHRWMWFYSYFFSGCNADFKNGICNSFYTRFCCKME